MRKADAVDKLAEAMHEGARLSLIDDLGLTEPEADQVLDNSGGFFRGQCENHARGLLRYGSRLVGRPLVDPEPGDDDA